MDKIILPQGYISWSAVDLFDKNPREFCDKYFYGIENKFENKYLLKGKEMADALVNPDRQNDAMLDITMAALTKYPEQESRLTVTFKGPHGEFDIMGYFDTYDPKEIKIREYKTGKLPWTQKRANNHGQLKHYACIIWLLTGKIPQIHLDWCETGEEADGSVQFTGKILTFEVKLTLPDILGHLGWLSKKTKEISDLYRKELNI